MPLSAQREEHRDHALVTGASGFVGRHLVRALHDGGHHITAIGRGGGLIDDVTVDAVDLADERAWRAWIDGRDGFDVVYHLAAVIPGVSTIAETDAVAANVRMTQAVAELAARGIPVVHASTAYVYDPSAPRPFREDSSLVPATAYHVAKLRAEQLLSDAARDGQCASLRIAAVYGPDQSAMTVLRRFISLAAESKDLRLHGTGARAQDFVHVADVVEAMMLVRRTRASGIFNIASGRSVSMRELADSVIAATLGSTSRVVLSGEADPQEHVRWEFSIDRARRAFGFAPRVSLEDGLRDLVARTVIV